MSTAFPLAHRMWCRAIGSIGPGTFLRWRIGTSTSPGSNLRSHLGGGGFAEVYAARQMHLQRDVAVKVFKEKGDDGRAWFAREAGVIGQVGTLEGIVPVYDSQITPEGQPYIVMMLCNGGSLADRLRSAPVPWPEACSIIAKAARGLANAHARHVLHRDIKPDNILFHDGEPLLADFGIAGFKSTTSGRASTTIGYSHGYVAPEVLQGDRAIEASDVHSLGVSLWAAIAGRGPYGMGSSDIHPGSLALKVVTEPLGPPGPPIPDELQALLDQVTDKRADARPSAVALAEALDAIVAGPAAGEATTRQTPAHAAPATEVQPVAPTSPHEVPDPGSTPVASSPPGEAAMPEQASDNRLLIAAIVAVVVAIAAVAAFALSRDGSSVEIGSPITPPTEPTPAAAPTDAPATTAQNEPAADQPAAAPPTPEPTVASGGIATLVDSPQLERILDRGEIVIGLQPRFVLSEAQPFHRAVGQELADRLGVEARFVDPGLDSTTFVASGQADILMNRIATFVDENALIAFAGAYALDGVTIVPPRGSGITDHRAFNGARIGVIDTSTADLVADNLGFFGLGDAELVRYPLQLDDEGLSSEDASKAFLDNLVLNGEIDARIGSSLEGDPEAIWLGGRAAVAMAFDISDLQFGAALDQIVLGMLDDGTIERLYRETLGMDPPYSVRDVLDFGSVAPG